MMNVQRMLHVLELGDVILYQPTVVHTHNPNPSNAVATFVQTSKPCHNGIHWIALAEYYQMSTLVPGFQAFFRALASFSIGQISQ